MVRKDKAKYMGWDNETKMFRRGWTPKWKCPKCGTWNAADTWKCTWCAYHKQSYKEGMQPKARVSRQGLLRRIREWKPFGELWRGEKDGEGDDSPEPSPGPSSP